MDKIGEGKKILVVDDQEDSRILVAKLLRHHGYEVVGARSGEEAIRAARKEVPDLILMDLRLPGGMDGLEATRRIKALPKLARIPIIAMTASVRAEDEKRALDGGCDGFLRKPIDIDTLPGQVADYIRAAGG